jgi:hypothetical protein
MENRRDFLKKAALIGTGSLLGFSGAPGIPSGKGRRFHFCTNTGALTKYPELFDLIVASGVNAVWMPYFLNGYEPYSIDDIVRWRKRFEEKGIPVQIANIPFGHPGNSLGGNPAWDTTPETWPKGIDINGNKYSGTSVHPKITAENVSAMRTIAKAGFQKVFVDDDFRLARSPGQIGGCFCSEHRDMFLSKYGYRGNDWDQLKQSIRSRELTPIVRHWIEFTCDDLTHSFRTMQAAAPRVNLGIMVMYLGAEKAGIRLNDYKGCLFRVGELMFDDRSFSPVKGKTNELFSALFHRRFVSPVLAYSETTAYPQDQLSAANMAAKLHITTIADIRNTMMMSGLEPFPLTHWMTLAPVMKKAAAMHRQIEGQVPKGPFKHFWAEGSRMVGKDQPNSLFLATGVPFEVSGSPASEGWTFLSEFDVDDVASGRIKSHSTTFIHGSAKKHPEAIRYVPEKMEDLFAFKHEILPQLKNVPYVEEDKPVVCAWYQKIRTVLLWNLLETKDSFTIKWKDKRRRVEIAGVDAELVPL